MATGRVRIEEGASLRIDLLRAEDQGWYECRVLFLDRHSTDADFQNGTWVHLTVTGNREMPPASDPGSGACIHRGSGSGFVFAAPPTFLETPPALVEVRDRDALSLTCAAIGNPQPVVSWKRSDLPVRSGATVQVWTRTPLRSHGGRREGKGTPMAPCSHHQVRNGTLSIAVVERASAGAYTCHASSKEGTITHTTRVLVQGKSRGRPTGCSRSAHIGLGFGVGALAVMGL